MNKEIASNDYGLQSAVDAIEAQYGIGEAYRLLCLASEELRFKIESTNFSGPRFSRMPIITIKKSRSQLFWEKVRTVNECWEWTAAKNKHGYGLFGAGSKGEIIVASRWSYMEANGDIPKGLCVCHKCDNPSCVRPDHLFLGTRTENHRDMMSKGRNGSSKGEKNGCSKLTEEQVTGIRTSYGRGESVANLAQQFSISRTGIRNILIGKTYPHVGDNDIIPNLKSKRRWITFAGQTLTLAAWSRMMGLSPNGLHYRLATMPFEEAMNKSLQKETSQGEDNASCQEDQDR
jgi:HNH endonuclease